MATQQGYSRQQKREAERAATKPRAAKGETFSEFFAEGKLRRYVRRGELLAVLTQYHESRKPWRRIWRFAVTLWARSARAPLAKGGA
jgi:hypothetical protein